MKKNPIILMLLPRMTKAKSCKFLEIIQFYRNHLQFMKNTTDPWIL